MKTLLGVVTAIGFVAFACTGTETQNPGGALQSFKDSGCKKENIQTKSTREVSASQALVSIDYSAETAGLKCVAWEASGTSHLKVDFYNYEGACGAAWAGKADVAADGALSLSIVNPECKVARCGWCVYDWSFDVDEVDVSKDVALTLGIDTCPEKQAVVTSTVTLPVASKPTGITCQYGNFNALGMQATALGTCGTVGMPCQGTTFCQSTAGLTEPVCAGDLICTDNGASDQRICAKACSNDDDCGSLGVLSCQSGLCRPRAD